MPAGTGPPVRSGVRPRLIPVLTIVISSTSVVAMHSRLLALPARRRRRGARPDRLRDGLGRLGASRRRHASGVVASTNVYGSTRRVDRRRPRHVTSILSDPRRTRTRSSRRPHPARRLEGRPAHRERRRLRRLHDDAGERSDTDGRHDQRGEALAGSTTGGERRVQRARASTATRRWSSSSQATSRSASARSTARTRPPSTQNADALTAKIADLESQTAAVEEDRRRRQGGLHRARARLPVRRDGPRERHARGLLRGDRGGRRRPAGRAQRHPQAVHRRHVEAARLQRADLQPRDRTGREGRRPRPASRSSVSRRRSRRGRITSRGSRRTSTRCKAALEK